MRGRDRAALVVVAIALGFATLAVGGAPRWAACIASLCGIASAVPYLTSRRTASRPSPLLWPLMVAAGLTALQLVPLPSAIAEHIVSAKLELVTDNATALGAPPPSWVVASYDPPATLVELAKLCGYLALAWTCVRLSSNRRARTWLAASVAGTEALVAAVTLVHAAVGAKKLYGIYTPTSPPTLLGPFINTNHLSALTAMGVPLALGLAVGARNIALRGAWLLAALVLSAVALMAGSRGGLVGLIAGVVLVSLFLFVQRRSGTDDTDQRIDLAIAVPAAIMTICTIVLLATQTAGDVARDFSRTSLSEVQDTHSKYQVWSDSTDLITDNRWLGVGHGAFEPAFTRLSPGGVTYAYAENDYLQAMIDWGLPGAAMLFLAGISTARVAVRRWRHGPIEAGAIASLLGLAIHEIADFSLEMPGVALITIATASVLLPERLGTTHEGGAKRPALSPRVIARRAATTTLAVVICALALCPLGRGAREEPSSPTHDGAEAAWMRHPSDYVLATRTAEVLFAERDPSAVEVVERALALDMRYAGAHQLAGRMLAMSQHVEQSAVEFAEALRWSEDARPIVDDVVAVFPDPAAAAKALPTDPEVVNRVYQALTGRDQLAFAYAQAAAIANPSDAFSQSLLAQLALAHDRPDLALPAARAAFGAHASAFFATLVGRALDQSGDSKGAVEFLVSQLDATARAPVSERVNMLLELADVQLATGDNDGATQTLDRATSIAQSDPSLLVAIHLKAALIDDRIGNPNQAAWERDQARQLGPAD